jgi:hypothetical protein
MRTAQRIAAVVGVIATVGVTAPAAQAVHRPVNEGGDTAPCVTYDEYLVVGDQFMHGSVTRGQVRRIFDTDGHRSDSDPLAGVSATFASPGYEVVVPRHKVTRHYLGCVDSLNPNGADVYVVFNVRTDHAAMVSWS